MLSLSFQTPHEQEIKSLWITSALWENQEQDNFDEFNMTNNIKIGGSPIFQGKFEDNLIVLDVSKFPNGFYRVYVYMNDNLFYDNLVINK